MRYTRTANVVHQNYIYPRCSPVQCKSQQHKHFTWLTFIGFVKSAASTSKDVQIIEPPAKAGSPGQVKATGQLTLDAIQVPLLVTEAEIKWILKVVIAHLSFRSCLGLNELFKSKFPDSAIADKFALSKTKCAYMINFGLGTYFRELLVAEIKASPFYVLCFDESLNPILQSCQMDCGIRYWDQEAGNNCTNSLVCYFIRCVWCIGFSAYRRKTYGIASSCASLCAWWHI